ncbi:MAG: diaminopimelate decarboxylase [Pseudomonadales bacterium]|nr:diaminopimelate decarboxylase [Pseudomonadales bacterium]
MTTRPQVQDELCIENVSASALADAYGTPVFVYSAAAITEAYESFTRAFAGHPTQVCYAVKANSNLGVLSLLARLGAGFDIVSGGELERVLMAGGQPDRIVFSGVGKQVWEIERALQVGIHCFNIESPQEIELIQSVAARLDRPAPVSFRVNPDVDAGTHPYISTGLRENKFGIAIADAPALYASAASLSHLRIIGVDCHIGSQITQLAPFLDAAERILMLVDTLAADGINLQHIDLGGGIGVRYQNEEPVDLDAYAGALLQLMGHRTQTLVFEPGRFIVANAGTLLTRVLSLKSNGDKHFAIVDAGMNDLIRPALYSAWQSITNTVSREGGEIRDYDIVGPICETGDFLGKQRALNLATGDLLAVASAGAYGFTMSSNYNSRCRAAEVMVMNDQHQCVRQRESIADLVRLESLFTLKTE